MIVPGINYEPERYGFELVAELKDPHASYSFDTIGVWRHIDSGLVYIGADSGCSCPCPFEGTDLELFSQKALDRCVDDWCSYDRTARHTADLHDFLRRLGAAGVQA